MGVKYRRHHNNKGNLSKKRAIRDTKKLARKLGIPYGQVENLGGGIDGAADTRPMRTGLTVLVQREGGKK